MPPLDTPWGADWHGEGLAGHRDHYLGATQPQVRITIRCPAAVTVTGRPTGTGAVPTPP